MKLFTIGPVEMLPEIKKVAGEQIPYFRTDEFSNIMLESDRLIKKLMNSGENSKSIYFLSYMLKKCHIKSMNGIYKICKSIQQK